MYHTIFLAWHPRVSPPANQLERLATGTDLYLVCQVSENEVGTDNVELLWYKDGTAMTRQKIRKNGFIQASLAFVKPTKAETGNYTCKATIGDESKEETVPVEFFERAGFVESKSSIHPQEGENAEITCETRGDRLDEIFWLKNGYQLSEADERGYQFEDDYRTLIIPDFFGEKDDGNYSCNVVQFAQIYTKDISVTAYSR
uniref:Ig-like domain-containing protein n=1 Tax=Panagrolaimus sp. PS1159 TaxID=55785 RepID=A0AC35FUV3_9BILA